MERRLGKLKEILIVGQKRNKQQNWIQKELQMEKLKQQCEEDSGWLKCNTDPRKTSPVFALQKQMIESRTWKSIKG